MNIRPKMVRILIIVVLVLAGVMAFIASSGRLVSAPQGILGTLAVPFQRFGASISRNLELWSDRNFNADSIIEENEKLKEEVNLLRKKQVEYDRLLKENLEFRKLLGIVDPDRTLDITAATVIGRDGLDKFYSFTIDRGTESGISRNDVVISSDGLVGIVVDTGRSFSKVSTILSPAVSVGAFVGPGREIGVVQGNLDLRDSERCMAMYLSLDTQVTKGDLVSSSGYGTVFPEDLIIGTVDEVRYDISGNYKYAVVTPSADIAGVSIVFVIKGGEG